MESSVFSSLYIRLIQQAIPDFFELLILSNKNQLKCFIKVSRNRSGKEAMLPNHETAFSLEEGSTNVPVASDIALDKTTGARSTCGFSPLT
ncbi:MAG: hypothetical protein F6K21_20605 [Symploca sp. SIO2D2]|nr:hypothetical protein [Symploca sp. SIO2D2]